MEEDKSEEIVESEKRGGAEEKDEELEEKEVNEKRRQKGRETDIEDGDEGAVGNEVKGYRREGGTGKMEERVGRDGENEVEKEEGMEIVEQETQGNGGGEGYGREGEGRRGAGEGRWSRKQVK